MDKEQIEKALKNLIDGLCLAITEDHIKQAEESSEPVHITGDYYLQTVCRPGKPTKYNGCFIKDIRKAEDGTFEIDIIYTKKDTEEE